MAVDVSEPPRGGTVGGAAADRQFLGLAIQGIPGVDEEPDAAEYQDRAPSHPFRAIGNPHDLVEQLCARLRVDDAVGLAQHVACDVAARDGGLG